MAKKKSKKLKEGTLENDRFKRCRQIQCDHFKDGHCRSCDECHSEPFILDKNCKRCYACENEPGYTRFDREDGEMMDEMNAKREALKMLISGATAELARMDSLEIKKKEKEKKEEEELQSYIG